MSANNAKTALATCPIWHLVDASQFTLGRLANLVARTLMGKHKPVYHPSKNFGDYVVVTNMRNVKLSGNKRQTKIYRYHTNHPGGLRTLSMQRLFDLRPDFILRKAVRGMLPRNILREYRLDRLKVFPGYKHPFEANLFKLYTKEHIQPIFPLRNNYNPNNAM